MAIVGLDVSHWQGTINWDKAFSAGVKFVIIKATEGTFYRDDRYEDNYKEAKRVGIKVGAYHFVRPGSADAQFQWFKRNLDGHVFDLPPALDVEVAGISEALVDNIGQKLENYMTQNPAQFPYFISYPHPMIYTNTYLGNTIFKSVSMSRYPLWLATRQTTNPDIPKIWKSKGLSVWQDAVTGGAQYGVKGNVDHNYWGTFLQFPGDTPPVPPPPPPPPPVVVTKEFTISIEIGENKYSNKVKLEKK